MVGGSLTVTTFVAVLLAGSGSAVNEATVRMW